LIWISDNKRTNNRFIIKSVSQQAIAGLHAPEESMSALSSSRKLRVALCACAMVMFALSSGCRSQVGSGGGTDTSGIIIVNAPAAGEIRRVLVREGMSVNKDAPIVEIVVRTEAPTAQPTQTEDPQARAARNIQSSKAEVEAARAEVVRTEVEVQRLTPLVATGQATQAELDGARAAYERAQQRFQKAQETERGAQSGLVTARQQSQNSSNAPPAPTEQIVIARASSAGKVTVINAQVGQRVTAGQALATLRAEGQ
jgi:multidrug efflux pump subunit AcrA (membrane-fusion protein)